MSPRPPVLHQLTEGATVGDAITDQALAIRTWLRSAGIRSDIYAAHIHPELAREIKPAAAYRPGAQERLVIYHHSIGSAVAEQLVGLGQRLLLIYHNVTPPEFYDQVDPALAAQLRTGRRQLAMLRAGTVLALGDSAFNAAELDAAGFAATGVLPIVIDPQRYDLPPDPSIVARCAGAGPLLLFVGRLTPNKRQEDLVKLLHYYRRIEPDAQLVLVGAEWAPAYARWIRDLTRSLGLVDQVVIAGHVTQQAMVTYYRLASLYVSMSEHEGFGKPLIESMICGLPVLAYAAASVPMTMGGAGVLFHRKEYEALAELAALLVQDAALRRRIVARQSEHARAFLVENVRSLWDQHLDSLSA